MNIHFFIKSGFSICALLSVAALSCAVAPGNEGDDEQRRVSAHRQRRRRQLRAVPAGKSLLSTTALLWTESWFATEILFSFSF